MKIYIQTAKTWTVTTHNYLLEQSKTRKLCGRFAVTTINLFSKESDPEDYSQPHESEWERRALAISAERWGQKTSEELTCDGWTVLAVWDDAVSGKVEYHGAARGEKQWF